MPSETTNAGAVAPLAYRHCAPRRLTTPPPRPTWANHDARSDVSTKSTWLCARRTAPDWSVVPNESVTATGLGEKGTPATTPTRLVAQKGALAPTSSDPSLQNNDYPDPGDNHGRDGGNIVFCDGRAQWVVQKRYLFSFFRGCDEYHDPIIP